MTTDTQGRSKIRSPLRFDHSSPRSAFLNSEEMAFGAAIHTFLARHRKAAPTCGEICDLLCDLGYDPPNRMFSVCVVTFQAELHAYKKLTGKAFPTWSEVLGVAKAVGWSKPS